VLACVVAETIGMTGASAAAWTSRDLDSTLLVWTVVVAGGVVEGVALGALQARALRPWLGARSRRAWFVVTVLVAGVGWGAASAPAAAAGDSTTGSEPPLGLILLAAAGLGLAMGVLLGVAQALVLRRELPRAWRWTWVSALAWTLTMPVIFLGATLPDASWSLPAVLLTGVLTGALAGTTYGVVTALLLPGLEGGRPSDQLVLHLLTSPLRPVLPDTVVALGVTGRRTGIVRRFPVQASASHDRLVVLPGHHERKTWWRNLDDRPSVELLRDGVWCRAQARIVRPEDRGWLADRYVYAAGLPNVSVPHDSPLVEVDLRTVSHL
jgi:hypothetical protein